MPFPLSSTPRDSIDLRFLKGDATQPQEEGPVVLPHVCNDAGGWGKSFSGALTRRWKEPEQDYRRLARRHRPDPIPLGMVLVVQVDSVFWVANMIAQCGYDRRGLPPSPTPRIRYPALRSALTEVAAFARTNNASIHAPRFGAGLARGDWAEVEHIIQETCTGLTVCIYDFEPPRLSRRRFPRN